VTLNNRELLIDDDPSSPLDRSYHSTIVSSLRLRHPSRCPNSIVSHIVSPISSSLTASDSTRKVNGVRLGQLIQRDLQKKERSTTANRDPHLELNISGKVLGEDGIKLVCGI
jgi:hypothetical protein